MLLGLMRVLVLSQNLLQLPVVFFLGGREAAPPPE